MIESDPSRFIEVLTWDYLNRLQAGVARGEVTVAEAPRDGSMLSRLQFVFNAKKLFKEIKPALDSSEYYLLMINGSQGSGKSTVARSICHTAHQYGYKLLYSSGFDLITAPSKLKEQAEGAKKVAIVVDDVSYILGATSSRTQSKVKNFFGMIRHALGGAQVLLIFITHVQSALPPILRNSNVWLFTAPTTLEYDTLVRLVGRGKEARESLQKTFERLTEIQSTAKKEKDVTLTFKGQKYNFRWGDRHDKGHGRLMLLVLNGEVMFYNSEDEHCPECQNIAFNVTIRPEDYTTKRPSEENEDETKK